MRKIGLLAVLTVVGMLSFSAVAMAATADPVTTDPLAQSYLTNGTGVGSPTTPGVSSGEAYRMKTDGTAGPAGTPNASGNNGTSWNSPTVADLQAPGAIKYDNGKIHSSYSKTSDACASCHAVHTAVGQGNLLQWEDPQTACWACHDGTVTATYNVITGTHSADGTEKVSSAGLFGTGTVATDGTGLSNHGMSPKEPAFVTTAAAPGGAEYAGTAAVPGVSAAVPNKDKNGNWSTEFSCIACHDPHGTFGNARILSPDPNGIQTAFRTSLGAGEVATVQADGITYKTKQGGWLSGHGVDPVVTVLNDPTNYKHSTTNSKETSDPNGHIVFQGEANNFQIDFKAGTVTFNKGVAPAAGSTVLITYTPGLVVDMTVSNKLTQNETVVYKSGINQFCGACHTDYNNVNKVPVWKTTDGKDTATSGNNGVLALDGNGKQIQATNADGTLKFKTGGAYNELLGEYRLAYRHSVGFTRTGTWVVGTSLAQDYPGLKFDTSNGGKMTVDCLTCHYAHGTSDAFITSSLHQDGITAFDGTASDGTTPLLQTADQNRTSALKRLPNMGVCQQCHNKQGAAPGNTLVTNSYH